ncbi:hypothetical protein DMUE_4624 [Dictyocoela muelleri]|nr:hypothetical protein DMUE_4624 [Dictyocoela muelleri]
MQIDVNTIYEQKILNIKLKIKSKTIINLLTFKLEGYIRNLRNIDQNIHKNQHSGITNIIDKILLLNSSFDVEILKSDEFILGINTNSYDEKIKIFFPATLSSLNCITKIEYFLKIKIISDNNNEYNFTYPLDIKVKNDYYVSKTYIYKNMVQVGNVDYLEIIFDKLRNSKNNVCSKLSENKKEIDEIKSKLEFLKEINFKNFTNDTILRSLETYQNCIEVFLINDKEIMSDLRDGNFNKNCPEFSKNYNVYNNGECIANIKMYEYINDSPINIIYLLNIKHMKLEIYMNDSGSQIVVFDFNDNTDKVISQDIDVVIENGIFSFECELFSVNFTAIFTFDDFEISIPVLVRNK